MSQKNQEVVQSIYTNTQTWSFTVYNIVIESFLPVHGIKTIFK